MVSYAIANSSELPSTAPLCPQTDHLEYTDLDADPDPKRAK